MKFPCNRLLCLAAFALSIPAGSASAATLLFSDNFNTPGQGNAGFNNASALASDQSGTAATKTYTTVIGGSWTGAFQRGNGGNWHMYSGTGGGTWTKGNMSGSLNYDIAAAANTLSSPLEIKFNINVYNGEATTDWGGFIIGPQNPAINATNVGFSSLFRDSGGTQQFSHGTAIGSSPTFVDGDLITVLISDASGSGSAFNSDGATDIVKMYVNGSLATTFTGLDLNAADQYISFNTWKAVVNIDNFTITAIPEPAAALLGSFGMIFLLRRRR